VKGPRSETGQKLRLELPPRLQLQTEDGGLSYWASAIFGPDDSICALVAGGRFDGGAGSATWFMGLAAVQDDSNGSRTPICCYSAREHVTVHDTWHVSGLRGTASCDFEVDDVFVPADQTHDFIAPVPTQPGFLYGCRAYRYFPGR
jgi:hypothetical protein